LGGLPRDQARAVVTSVAVNPAMRPVYVRALGQSYAIPARGIVSASVDEILDQAFAPRTQATVDELAFESLTASVAPVTIVPRYTVDSARIAAWVANLAATTIDAPARNASLRISGNRPIITSAREGYRLDRVATAQRIQSAMLAFQAQARIAIAPVAVLKPTVPDSRFARVIVVDKSERRLYLYEYSRLERSFRVAVGMNRYPTPLGSYKVVKKRYRPAWYNPGSAWAASMPRYIPPGPSNPLGTRALNLNAPGIRIHGTNNISSIGTAASHGCIRMLRKDVEWLYPRVEVNTPVYVVR